ncbi:MurR/RpiR family transcriptional regulator [Oscillospiraceae bacterium MB08-C2-2]|nr:MurR/RpiR family transcriptional regulator [Oscillospiraceae bacterium MB08-C2-2]
MLEQTIYDYEYLNRIKEHYPVYSESEKKIADFFLENVQPENMKQISSMSAVELAEATATSSATIIRFCRALGFKGLTELKYYINKGILSPHRRGKPLTADDSMSVVRQKVGNTNKIAIDDTILLLDDKDLSLAVEKIAEARQILMASEGGSGCSAKLAELMFMQLGLNCQYPEDGFLQILYANQLATKDVMIAISHSGRASNTIDLVKYAKKRGIFVIGITSIVNAPLAKLSDIILYTSSMEQEYFSNTAAARICEISVISILHSALLQRSESHIASESKIHHLYEMKRIKPSR